MTTTKTTKKRTDRTKVRLNIRLYETTKQQLANTAIDLGVSETDVIEMALREKFANLIRQRSS